MSRFSFAIIIGWSCVFILQFDWSYQSSVDIKSSLNHTIDKVALDLLRSYDKDRNKQKSKRRLLMQKEETIFRNVIPLQKLVTNYPADIVKISIQRSASVTEHLIAVANLFEPKRIMDSTVDIYRYNASCQRLQKIHTLKAIGSYELEYFPVKTAGGLSKHLLVVGGNAKHIENGHRINTRLAIYEIKTRGQDILVEPFQHFDVVSVDAVKSFTRSNQTYLVIGMRLHANMVKDSPSKVLVLHYSERENHFRFHSTLAAAFIGDIEVFDVNGILLMAVAYFKDAKGNYDLNSPLYKFEDKTGRFVTYQTIPTSGASDVEWFHVMNEHFLVVANTATKKHPSDQRNVHSSFFQFVNKKFQLISKIATYGAVKWKSTVLPNCNNVVLLTYADQGNTVDQVGLLLYRERFRKFEKISLSFYDSILNSFRPVPKALATFLVNEDLFVVVGATNITHGYNFFKVEYQQIGKATATGHIASGLLDDLAALQRNLVILQSFVQGLENAFAKFDVHSAKAFKGSQTFYGHFQADYLKAKNLTMVNGSLNLSKAGNLSLQKSYGFDDIRGAYDSMSKTEMQVSKLNSSMNQALMLNMDASIHSPFAFSSVRATLKQIKARSINVSDCIVSGINLCHLQADIVMNRTHDTITGAQSFANDVVMSGDLEIGNLLNNIAVPKDLIDSKSDQSIDSGKTFQEAIFLESIKLSGSLNGIDLKNESLSLSKPETIFELKTFASSINADEVIVKGVIDSINVTDLEQETLDKFSEQNITGKKILEQGSEVNGNIAVSNSTNSFNIDSMSSRIVSFKGGKTALPDGIAFNGKVHIRGNLTVTGKIEMGNLSFPGDIVLISGKQEITGKKAFIANMSARGNVSISGLIDNLDVNDAVSISKPVKMDGKKTLVGSVRFLENVSIAKENAVNGVDLSELGRKIVTLHGKQDILDLTISTSSITTHNGMDVVKKIDNLPVTFFENLYKRAVLYDANQNLTGSIRFMKNVTANGNLSVEGMINGYSFPTMYLQKRGDQNISASFTLHDVKFKDNVSVSQPVSGYELNVFGENLIKTDTAQSISGVKHFVDDVIVEKSVLPCCSINNFSLANLLTKNTSQEFSANKHFTAVEEKTILNVTVSNAEVGSTVDGIDMSDLKDRALQAKEGIHIDSLTMFTNVVMPNGLKAKRINKIDLDMLESDIVTVDSDQIISTKKAFHELIVESNLLTNSTLDGIDVSELSREVVRVNETTTINSIKGFHNIKANDVKIAGLVHGVDLQNISEVAVMKTADANVTGMKRISGKVTMSKHLKVEKVNNICLADDVVRKTTIQAISGRKELINSAKVNGNVTMRDSINDENLASLYQTAMLKSKEQYVRGRKVFLKDLESKMDVSLDGTIKAVDLSLLNQTLVPLKGGTLITGAKTFASNISVEESMEVEGLINHKDFKLVTSDAVVMKSTEKITGHKRFTQNVIVTSDIKAESVHVATGLVNRVNVTLLDTSALKIDAEQVITGLKRFQNNVTVKNDIVISTLQGKDPKDFVNLDGNQTIKGHKTFSNVQCIDDVVIYGKTDGEDLTKLAADTLLKSHTQNVTGYKNFAKFVTLKSNLVSHGMVDTKALDSRVVTINTEQKIEQKTVFENDISVGNISIIGRISGLNVSALNNQRLTLNTKQAITSDVTVEQLKCQESIVLGGQTNEIKLLNWKSTLLTFVKNTTEKHEQMSTLAKRECNALSYIKDILLKGTELYIDQVNLLQYFQFGVNHFEPFSIGNKHYIALVRSLVTPLVCENSEVMIYHKEHGRYETYQYLSPAAGSRFKSFECNAEMFLLLNGAENGCMKKGESILYKWNTTAMSFEVLQYIESSQAINSNAVTIANDTFLAIANTAPAAATSVDIWKYMRKESRFVRLQTIPSSRPAAIEFFEIEGNAFMGIANSYDHALRSSNTLSEIHRFDRGLSEWKRVQRIPTSGALDLKYFKDRRHHFLAFTSDKLVAFRYSNITGLFTLDHSFKVPLPVGMSMINLESANYMMIVSKGAGIYLYRFRPYLGYELRSIIPHPKITYVTSFLIDGKPHLAVGGLRNADDKLGLEDFFPRILQARVSGFRSSQFNCS